MWMYCCFLFAQGKEDVEVEIEQRKVVESRNTFTFIAAGRSLKMYKYVHACIWSLLL